MHEYKYADGFHAPKGVSAKDAHEETERIRLKHDKLLPKILVDESRDESAVLHKAFEWDDWIAAESHRSHQASRLIRAIVRYEEVEEVECREYVFIKETEETKSYFPVNIVVNEPNLYKEAIRRMKNQINSLVKIANQFDEFAESDGYDKRKIGQLSNALKKVEAVAQLM